MSTYGKLTTAFVPTGAGTTLSADFLYTPDGTVQQLLDGGPSEFRITIDSSDVLSFNLLASAMIDGVAATSGVTVIQEGWHTITGSVSATEPDVIPYRYFRVLINANNGDASYVTMHEMELATSPGGATVTAIGMVTDASSQVNVDNGSENIVDGIKSGVEGSWHSAANDIVGAWVLIDTVVPNSIAEVRIWPRDNESLTRAIKDFDFQGSSNGADWTTIESFTNVTTWVLQEPLAFDVSGNNTKPTEISTIAAIETVLETVFQFFRLFMTDNDDGQYYGMHEIELATSPGGADITSPGMPAAASGSNDAGNLPDNIIDDDFTSDPGGAWASNNTAVPEGFSWIHVDTGGSFVIRELRIWPTRNLTSRAPKDFRFEGSNDSVNWTILETFAGVTGWVTDESKTFAIPIATGGSSTADTFHTQIHNLILTDPLNGANSISIDASIEAATMPTDTDMTDPTGLISYGTWINLHPTQPYVPLLKGGADADRSYVEFKHEAYNGDFSA